RGGGGAAGGERSAGGADLRGTGDQAGAVRTRLAGQELAAGRATLVRARGALPCAAALPAGQPGLRAAGTAAGGRRLRRGTLLLVRAADDTAGAGQALCAAAFAGSLRSGDRRALGWGKGHQVAVADGEAQGAAG